VEERQRTGILEALAEELSERDGAAGTVTVTHVIARAGVSRRTFYELFVDREACLLAAFDLGVERAAARILPALAAESRWRDGIRVALAAFLGFLEDEPALGRLCVVHTLGAGSEVLRRRTEVLKELWEAIDRGRLESPAGRAPSNSVVAEGVVGAVLSVLHTRLQAQDEQPLMQLFGPLMSIVVLPYLGSSVARRELARPAPKLRPRSRGGSTEPGSTAEDPGVRLTYRTMRVLTEIAEYPGASNREVAERAGIVDQGQISKLLARLLSEELIANMGEGSTRGAPNAWRLTERGERVLEAAGARSEELRSPSPRPGAV
jgi:AcrR family transcriptional regulator/DNA-binding MarR family transcriptional regulator